MRIIETDNNYIYILSDKGKVISYNSFWGIGTLIKKENINEVSEISDAELYKSLQDRDKQL